MLLKVLKRAHVGCSAQPASNPFEDFQRVFSKFASAEEVTGAAPAEDEEAAAEEDEKPVKEEVGCPLATSGVGVMGTEDDVSVGRGAAEEYEGPCRETQMTVRDLVRDFGEQGQKAWLSLEHCPALQQRL